MAKMKKAPIELLLDRGWHLHGLQGRAGDKGLLERRGRQRLLIYGLLMVETAGQSNRS